MENVYCIAHFIEVVFSISLSYSFFFFIYSRPIAREVLQNYEQDFHCKVVFV